MLSFWASLEKLAPLLSSAMIASASALVLTRMWRAWTSYGPGLPAYSFS